MARTIAILMMIEGHFTGAALDASYRNEEYPLYYAWHLFHGLTAPMFFTVTGLIFVYLLLGNESYSFWSNPRVNKGFKRISTLFFWGYLIQFNLRFLIDDLSGIKPYNYNTIFGFHVLQSIAMCLAIIILTYGIYKLIKKGPVYLYFLLMAVLMLVVSGVLRHYIGIDKYRLDHGITSEPNYWPHHFPVIIQNMFYGPQTAFSFVHTATYTLIGGMIGAIIKLNQEKVKNYGFILRFLLGGILLSLLSVPLLHLIKWMIFKFGIVDQGYFHENIITVARLGQVIAVLGALMLVDKLFTIKSGLFLKIGQHTLPIYVVHVIILYGGITGLGLKPEVFNRDLAPYWAILISITAMSLSALMVKYIEPLERIYNRIFFFWRENKSKS